MIQYVWLDVGGEVIASGVGEIARCKEKLVLNVQHMNDVKKRRSAVSYTNQSGVHAPSVVTEERSVDTD